MKEYQFHPLCTAFPAMSPELYARRREDYRQHPKRANESTVLLAKDGKEWKIADGRHHYLICQELGYECEFAEFTGTDDELAAVVLAHNLNRRQLEPAQIAAVVVKVNEWKHGGDRKGKSSTDQVAPVQLDHKTQAETAEESGISARTLAHANKVKKEAPELLSLVRDGKLDAKTAAECCKLPLPERKKISRSENPKKAAKEALAAFNAANEPSEPTVIVTESTPAGEPIPDPAEVNKRGAFPFGANAEQPAPEPEQEEKTGAVILPLVVDEWGIPIQPHAVSAFATVPLFKELLQSIQNTQRLFNKVANHEGGRFLTLPEVSSYRRGKKTGDGEYEDRFVHEGIEAAYRQVKNAIPTHTVCPWHYVDAPHPENCRTCLGLNWTPELSKNIPDEAKQRAQQQFNVSEGDNV